MPMIISGDGNDSLWQLFPCFARSPVLFKDNVSNSSSHIKMSFPLLLLLQHL